MQPSSAHAVLHLMSHNLKFVAKLYIPLSLLFLVREAKTFSPSILLKAIKSGVRSGLWLGTCVLNFPRCTNSPGSRPPLPLQLPFFTLPTSHPCPSLSQLHCSSPIVQH